MKVLPKAKPAGFVVTRSRKIIKKLSKPKSSGEPSKTPGASVLPGTQEIEPKPAVDAGAGAKPDSAKTQDQEDSKTVTVRGLTLGADRDTSVAPP